jgi:hypothetical protein
LVIVVASVLLAFPAAARAQSGVSWSPLTNDPVVMFTSNGTVECSNDGVTYAACTSPWRPTVGADGKYAFYLRDSAVPFSGTFTLDRTPPAIAFTAGPADYSFAATDAHPGTLECTVDGAAAPCSGTVAVPGAHPLAARPVDAAGNASTDTRTLTLAQPQVTHVDAKPEGGVLSTTASSPSAKLTSTHTRRWTRLRSLTLRDVEIGTAIKAACNGKGCPKRALRLTATKTSVSLAGLTGRKLAPGTVIKITLSAKGKVTRTFTITIRATRAPQVS